MPEVAFFLSQTLAQLDGYWLELRCCGMTMYPLRLLYLRHPADVPLEKVIKRLRCRRCGGRSKDIFLSDRPNAPHPADNPSGYLRLQLPVLKDN